MSHTKLYLNMKKLALLFGLFFSLFLMAQKKYVVVIHGGAGTIIREKMSPELEEEYLEKLTEAFKKLMQKLKTVKLPWKRLKQPS